MVKVNQKRIFTSIVTTTLSVIGLLVIFGGIGAAYIWYSGQQEPLPVVVEDPKSSELSAAAPPPEAPNAKVGASVQALTSPVTPGSNASITIKTNANAECAIKAVYNKIPSTDSGLGPKTANERGIVSWTWTVEVAVPIGKWPVTVTCVKGEQSAVVQGDLVVAYETAD